LKQEGKTMSRKTKRKKIREEKKAIDRARRQERINSLIATYNRMSLAEQILGSIALAFVALSLFSIGYLIPFIIFGSVAFIMTVLTAMLYQGRQRKNKRLLKFIEIQNEIDLKSIKELIGWSEKSTLSSYIDIISSGNKSLFYDIKTTKLHWVGPTAQKVATDQSSVSASIPQEKIYCTYCGNENEINTDYCVSCGDPIT